MLFFKRLSLLPILVLFIVWLPLSAHAQWFSSSSHQDEFLPVTQAFQPTAWHNGNTLYIGMDIADEYYLYRHQFAVSSQTKSVSLGEPEIPQAPSPMMSSWAMSMCSGINWFLKLLWTRLTQALLTSR